MWVIYCFNLSKYVVIFVIISFSCFYLYFSFCPCHSSLLFAWLLKHWLHVLRLLLFNFSKYFSIIENNWVTVDLYVIVHRFILFIYRLCLLSQVSTGTDDILVGQVVRNLLRPHFPSRLVIDKASLDLLGRQALPLLLVLMQTKLLCYGNELERLIIRSTVMWKQLIPLGNHDKVTALEWQ